jgi:hypothetical protein
VLSGGFQDEHNPLPTFTHFYRPKAASGTSGTSGTIQEDDAGQDPNLPGLRSAPRTRTTDHHHLTTPGLPGGKMLGYAGDMPPRQSTSAPRSLRQIVVWQ